MGGGAPLDLTPAVDWLLASDDESVVALARRHLLDEEVPPVLGWRAEALLSWHVPGEHPYRKWTGAHWRLVSLVELEVPADEPRLAPMVDAVLTWLEPPHHLHASQEGNALAVCARLGVDDERVDLLVERLLASQWPDGGWNCDRRPEARQSSFHETLAAVWGLHERGETGAARRGAELLLSKRLFRRRRDGSVVHPSWLAFHFPPYWHYDVLQALLVLSRMGLAADPRAADALDVVRRKRLRDGRWRPGGRWWSATQPDVVDWATNEMVTLNALRVLRLAT